MENTVVRGSTRSLLIVVFVLCGMLITFSLTGFYIFAVEPGPEGWTIVAHILLTAIFVFAIVFLCTDIMNYFTCVTISEDTMIWSRPFRKRKIIPLEQLTFWGCVSFFPRSTFTFFMTEDETKLLDYFQAHQSECCRFFGDDRVKQLQSSDAGRIQLSVGTYIRLHRSWDDKIFVLGYGSTRMTKRLVGVLKRDAMITGSWLLNSPSDWEAYIRYKAK